MIKGKQLRIVICGSRDWVEEDPILSLIKELKKDYEALTIVAGGARGVDSIAEKLAKQEGLNTMVFRARWDIWGKSAGPIRNKEMLDTSSPGAVYAFKSKPKSVGTDDCITKAKAMGIPTWVYLKGEGWVV